MGDIEEALIALRNDGLKVGTAWQEAHQLAQRHEGEPAYDLLHALLHRIEGDDANAAYWYRRAGEPVSKNDPEDEVERLIERAKSQAHPTDHASQDDPPLS